MGNPVALIGFGEAAMAFVEGLDSGRDCCVYDIKTDDNATRPAKQADYARAGVRGCETPHGAVAGASLVLSLVTADQALAAVDGVCTALDPGAIFCDMNSVAPQKKRAAAIRIEEGGGRYADVAIMAPVWPGLTATPLLVSGSHSGAAASALRHVGFTNVGVIDGPVGTASAIKMIRSIIVKGIEALTAEAMLAAEAAGVVREVLASLDASETGGSWTSRADYNLGRMVVHGLRRAEEMEEAARMLEGLRVDPWCTRATVRWQRQIGSQRVLEPAAGISAKIAQIRGRKADAA